MALVKAYGTLCLLCLFSITHVLPTFAETPSTTYPPEIEEAIRDMSLTILSPFCPGRTLADCPSSAATELRHKIGDMMMAGKTNEQIINELYALYGEQIRATPKMEGFGWLGWFAPAIFFTVGVCVIALWLRFNGKAPVQSPRKRSLDPALEEKIKAEVGF